MARSDWTTWREQRGRRSWRAAPASAGRWRSSKTSAATAGRRLAILLTSSVGYLQLCQGISMRMNRYFFGQGQTRGFDRYTSDTQKALMHPERYAQIEMKSGTGIVQQTDDGINTVWIITDPGGYFFSNDLEFLATFRDDLPSVGAPTLHVLPYTWLGKASKKKKELLEKSTFVKFSAALFKITFETQKFDVERFGACRAGRLLFYHKQTGRDRKILRSVVFNSMLPDSQVSFIVTTFDGTGEKETIMRYIDGRKSLVLWSDKIARDLLNLSTSAPEDEEAAVAPPTSPKAEASPSGSGLHQQHSNCITFIAVLECNGWSKERSWEVNPLQTTTTEKESHKEYKFPKFEGGEGSVFFWSSSLRKLSK